MSVPILTVTLPVLQAENLGAKALILNYLSCQRSPLNGRPFEVKFQPGIVERALLVGLPSIKGIGPTKASRLGTLVRQAYNVSLRQQMVGTLDF